jgi:hypothetical protein
MLDKSFYIVICELVGVIEIPGSSDKLGQLVASGDEKSSLNVYVSIA